MIHELKTHPEYFVAVDLDFKTFEIRKNDRGFQVGDILYLREFEPGCATSPGNYTGRTTLRRVTYITEYAQHSGFVVMAITRSGIDHDLWLRLENERPRIQTHLSNPEEQTVKEQPEPLPPSGLVADAMELQNQVIGGKLNFREIGVDTFVSWYLWRTKHAPMDASGIPISEFDLESAMMFFEDFVKSATAGKTN